jgi:alpha-ketoglutarate-dependent taurine dioxygenase
LTDADLLGAARQLNGLGEELVPSPIMQVESVPGTPYLTLTNSAVPLHNDGMFRWEPPRYVLLYCEMPGSRGGLTFFARGDRVAAMLDPRTRRILEVYSFRIQLGSLVARRRALQEHPRDGMPVLMLGDPSLATNFKVSIGGGIQADRILGVLRAILGDRRVVCYRHRWKRHDLLVFDNYKVLHGRTRYTGQRVLKRVEISASDHYLSAEGKC